MGRGVRAKLGGVGLEFPLLAFNIAFYGALGHPLIWRVGNHAAGLRLPDSDAEIVIHTNQRPLETCLLVQSVPQAIERIISTGGTLVNGPFEIQVGLYAMLHDPWNNPADNYGQGSRLLLSPNFAHPFWN